MIGIMKTDSNSKRSQLRRIVSGETTTDEYEATGCAGRCMNDHTAFHSDFYEQFCEPRAYTRRRGR